MPRRTIVIITCSLCGEERREDEITLYTLALPSKERVRYEVCKVCGDDEPFKTFLSKGEPVRTRNVPTRTVKPTKKTAAAVVPSQTVPVSQTHPCGVGQCVRTFSTLQGLRLHRTRVHNMRSEPVKKK